VRSTEHNVSSPAAHPRVAGNPALPWQWKARRVAAALRASAILDDPVDIANGKDRRVTARTH
jgi:hypothetical protein